MFAIDLHCDAPSQMLRLRDYGKDNGYAQVDFPKMKRGKVDASVFALYIPASLKGKEATEHAFRLLEETERQIALNKDKVALATTVEELEQNKRNGLLSIMLGIENASAIQESFDLLHQFYERGVRYITLTHSADNLVGDSCTGSHTWGGLSRFGRELVREMNGIGMLVDVAHASDETIRDVLKVSKSPIAYTHGCCRALASHVRNLDDGLLEGIAENGGVAGMSIYPVFMSDGFAELLGASGLEAEMKAEDEFIKDPGNPEKARAWHEVQERLSRLERPGPDRVVEHIEHAVSVAGIDHVGIGTDYDGIEVTASGLEDISSLQELFQCMERHGFSASEVSKVAGGNFLSLLGRIRPIR